MSKLRNEVLDIAIENCLNQSYPVLVTGQDFGDDLANALVVVKELNSEVERLKKVVERLLDNSTNKAEGE